MGFPVLWSAASLYGVSCVKWCIVCGSSFQWPFLYNVRLLSCMGFSCIMRCSLLYGISCIKWGPFLVWSFLYNEVLLFVCDFLCNVGLFLRDFLYDVKCFHLYGICYIKWGSFLYGIVSTKWDCFFVLDFVHMLRICVMYWKRQFRVVWMRLRRSNSVISKARLDDIQ